MTAQALRQVRFTDAQALEFLRLRSPVRISGMALAEQFGWHRNTVGSKLQSWAAKGEITRQGQTIVVQDKAAQPAQKPAQAVHNPPPAPAQDGTFIRRALSFAMVAAGVLLIAALIYINAKAWSSFMQSSEDAWAIRAVTVTMDVLAALLPTCAYFAPRHHRWKIWCMWFVCTAMHIWTVVSFTSSSFEQTVGTRGASIESRETMKETLAIKKRQLAGLPTFSPVSQEMLNAKTVKRQTDCDPDRLVVSRCKTAQGELDNYAQLRSWTAMQERLTAEITVLNDKLKDAPFIASADPLVAGPVRTLRNFGISLDERAISSIIHMTFAMFMIVCSGPLICIGVSIW